MHSSGRGEESPEAYRGVVLPSAQHQQQAPYGDQVQPAGGTPWGSPQAPALPQQTDAADATQMMPPYPAGPHGPAGPAPVSDATQMMPPYPGTMPGPGPVPGPGAYGHGNLHGADLHGGADPHGSGAPAGPAPVADATQMLPPYPGADPFGQAGPQQGAMPGAVPPLPPMPPQAPPTGPEASQQGPGSHRMPGGDPRAPYGFDSQPGQPGQPPAGASDGTQVLPLSIFEEQQQQQSFEQAYPQHDYGQDPYQQQGAQSQTEHDSDYDHLFRNDVPGPPPMRQRIIQPPSAQQQPAMAGPGAMGGQPPYGAQGYDNGYGYDDGLEDGGRRRLSPKVLIGIVVAGCVVAGLVVGGLLNSGGSASANNTPTTSATPSAGTSASASGSGNSPAAAGNDAAKQQAQALDSLLNTSGNSRSSVVNAVGSVKNCRDLGGAASALRTASGQRTGLVTKLGSLSVDKLPNHAALTDALTKAWTASAAADSHYANWADQAQSNHHVCKGGTARSTGEAQAANQASGTATEQKKRAVKLWNAIARQYGLTQREFSQL